MKACSVTLEARTGSAWGASPVEVFEQLAHLSNPVFLDSSGNLPQDTSSPYSMIAADPEEIVTGSLQDKVAFEAFAKRVEEEKISAPDCGIPLGAWIGTIDYEGEFWFGLYRNLLVFAHQTEEWFEVGDGRLSQKRQEACALKPPQWGAWTANCTQEEFEHQVLRAQDYITAGDIYQVNLAQRFEAKYDSGELLGLYRVLRESSPSPMGAYLDTGVREILCSSPELFLRLSGSRVQTRPIKGTRPRYENPEQDIRSSYELKTSPKEMAELLMITDLLRNDLGKICEFGSVKVDALAHLESLAQVHHLVSTITGTLREEITHLAAVKSCSPGGSITGAPKKRAMEIIAEIEAFPRGLYTGSIGYLGLNGESQFNIVIRSLIRESGLLHYHVGAGIVADSQPAAEYEETLQKARGLREALEHVALDRVSG